MWFFFFPLFVFAMVAALVAGAFLAFRLTVVAIAPSAAPMVGLLFFAACIVVGFAIMHYAFVMLAGDHCKVARVLERLS